MNTGLYDCVCCELIIQKDHIPEYPTKLINSNSPKPDLVDIHIENSPIITTSPTKSESLFVVSNLNLTSFRSRILIKRIFFLGPRFKENRSK